VEKDQQLRKLVHDLKNCLAPVRNALRLLERPEADAATSAYARGLIDKQIIAMERLCDALIGGAGHTAAALPAAAPGAEARRRSILIVDDNRSWVDSLALVLRDAGHTVYTAYGGRRAVEIAEELKPDVVILDIEMPEVSGYEAARQLRRRLSRHRPTLIALTVWSDDMDKALAREAGFDHHLSKPMAFDDLVRILAAA
jgi:CheY-like chemotaxis protein